MFKKITRITALCTLFLQISASAFGAAKLSNADFMSLAQIIAAGGSVVDLLNDTKMYSTVLGQQMSVALTSGTLANTTVPFLMSEFATPANPAATKHKLYFKADGNLYMLDSAGVETQVNGGSGSGFPVLDTVYVVQDDGDITKTQLWQLAGQTTGTALTLASSNTGSRTITFPDFTDTVAVLGSVQTITSKVFPAEGAGANTINGMAVNNFSYSDAAGKLSSLPGWGVTVGNNIFGANVQQQLDLPAGPGNLKVHDFETEINPAVVSSSDSFAFTLDTHVDRTGSNNNMTGNTRALALSTTHEGNGTISDFANILSGFSLGTGANTGTTTNASHLALGTGVGAGYTVGTLSGITNIINIDAAATVTDVGNLAVTMNGNAGGNYIGVNHSSLGTVGGNYVGIVDTHSAGAISGTENGITTISSGAVTGNYQAYGASQAGNTGGWTGLSLTQVSGNSGAVFGINAALGGASGTATGKTGLSLQMGNGATAGSGRYAEFSAGTGSYTNFVGLNLNNQDIVTTAGGYTGLNIGATGAASVDSFTGTNINWNGAVTNNFTGIDINAAGGTTAAAATGVNVTLDNVDTGAAQKTGVSISDGRLIVQSNYNTSILPPSPGFISTSSLGGNYTVAAGFPQVATGAILNNLGLFYSIQDDVGIDGFGGLLGIANTGFLANIDVATGKTMHTQNLMLAAASVTGPGTGTITNGYMYNTAGYVNGGGTITVTNLAAFNAINGLCGMATNCWGVKVNDAAAHNSFAGDVVVGAATPSNASVGLELNSTTQAILNPRMTTAQRTGLTPLDGMQVYDTDFAAMYCYENGAWAACGSGGGGGTNGLVAQAFKPGTTNCDWSVTSTTRADFTADTDCPPPTVQNEGAAFTGIVDTTNDFLPQLVLTNLPAGTYYVNVQVATTGANTADKNLAISDGTTNDLGLMFFTTNGTTNIPLNLNAVFVYGATGTRTFKVQGSASSGTLSLSNGSADSGRLSFIVMKLN